MNLGDSWAKTETRSEVQALKKELAIAAQAMVGKSADSSAIARNAATNGFVHE